MQHLVAEVFELAGALRRDGETTAKLAGQTQARWQVMWIAATGRLSVPMIARRLGLARQSVQRVADEIVAEGHATFEPNPDHQRSPLLILTSDGQAVLDTINSRADNATSTPPTSSATKGSPSYANSSLMLVGGNRISGIHGAHFGPGVHIRFAAADAKRQTIPWIEYNTDKGEVRHFVTSDAAPDSATALPQFEMQCVDCHNRPTHTFDLPERAVDKALALGDIAAGLPYIKKKSVELLKANYATSAEAAAKLPSALAAFYQQSYPDVYAARSPDIHQAGEAVLAIYNRNVFPDLKVTWGTYPNNLGHTDFPGCFRCHDGSHTTTDGETITQDCNTCHEPLAVEEASPEILRTLGLADRISKVQKQ